ncbi:MAG: alanine racemase [Betaproteobacteria bacterium]
MARPIKASFDLTALRNNFAVARHLAGAAKVMAVIKANAYGHGLLRVARALADVDAFALLELDDAIRLRDAGYRQRILLLEGFFHADELPVILHHGFSVVIHNEEQIAQLGKLHADRKLEVFVKLNTGMNRLGFPADQASRVLEQLKALPCIGEVVLTTHFSDAEGVSGIEWQMREFERHVARPGYARSLANSAALLRFPEARGEWVRPGIMLYGASPLEERTGAKIGLRPAMSLTSEIIGIQLLQRGDTVGYGSLFTADRQMRIGVVACGYADGYPRHAYNGTPVLVEGVRVPTVGRVSMDMLCVDLSDVPRARIGSPVTLWGVGLPVEEVAAAAGTVSYELLCALARRVPVEDRGGD